MIEEGNDGFPEDVECTQSMKNEVVMDLVKVDEDETELDVQEDMVPLDFWGKGQEGLSELAKSNLKMQNQDTEQRYTGYLKDFYDYNEHEQVKGITGEVTLCNFISFLRENRSSDGSLWCVYTTLNKHYKQVTKDGRLQDLMLLQTIIRNATRQYVSKKSASFTAAQLKILLYQQGIDEDDPLEAQQQQFFVYF